MANRNTQLKQEQEQQKILFEQRFAQLQQQLNKVKEEADIHADLLLHSFQSTMAASLQSIIDSASESLAMCNPNTVRVEFSIVANTHVGQDVLVSGNTAHLGNWDLERAFSMKYGIYIYGWGGEEGR